MKIAHSLMLDPDTIGKAIVHFLDKKGIPPSHAKHLSVRLRIGSKPDADGDPITCVIGAEVTWEEETDL